MQGRLTVLSKPMEKDAATNRNIVMQNVQEIRNWRQTRERFSVHLIPVNGDQKVGLLAKRRFELQMLKTRSSVFVDDTSFFDDRDMPPMEVFRPDAMVSSMERTAKYGEHCNTCQLLSELLICCGRKGTIVK